MNTLLINIDESSINRNVETLYPWALKKYQMKVEIPLLLVN